jgi:acetyltransferase-like isoleucine patch superfamily enzyme
VVRERIPPRSVAYGIPAKVARTRGEERTNELGVNR